MISSVLWDVTQRILVVSGQPASPTFKDQVIGPWRVGPASCPVTTVTNTNLRRVTYQKGEDLSFVTHNKSDAARVPTEPAVVVGIGWRRT